jgi:hypothetical protein
MGKFITRAFLKQNSLSLSLSVRERERYVKLYFSEQISEPVFTLEREQVKADSIPFPLPWDVPLSAYGADDDPWVHEYLV